MSFIDRYKGTGVEIPARTTGYMLYLSCVPDHADGVCARLGHAAGGVWDVRSGSTGTPPGVACAAGPDPTSFQALHRKVLHAQQGHIFMSVVCLSLPGSSPVPPFPSLLHLFPPQPTYQPCRIYEQDGLPKEPDGHN